MVQLVQKHNEYEYISGERCIMHGRFLIFLQVRYSWGEKYWSGGGHWSFRVRWDPVTWLLIDGLFCLIRSASMIWRRKGSLFVYIIFALLTRISLVSLVPWAVSRCDLGPPEARCIVSLRDKLVWVMPIYVFGRSAQSPILQVSSYISLMHLNGGTGVEVGLLRKTRLVMVWLE